MKIYCQQLEKGGEKGVEFSSLALIDTLKVKLSQEEEV